MKEDTEFGRREVVRDSGRTCRPVAPFATVPPFLTIVSAIIAFLDLQSMAVIDLRLNSMHLTSGDNLHLFVSVDGVKSFVGRESFLCPVLMSIRLSVQGNFLCHHR